MDGGLKDVRLILLEAKAINKYTNISSTDLFENHSEEDDIYPLMVKEITDAKKAHVKLNYYSKDTVLPKGVTLQKVEDISCLCDNNRMIIPKPFQKRATQ